MREWETAKALSHQVTEITFAGRKDLLYPKNKGDKLGEKFLDPFVFRGLSFRLCKYIVYLFFIAYTFRKGGRAQHHVSNLTLNLNEFSKLNLTLQSPFFQTQKQLLFRLPFIQRANCVVVKIPTPVP